MLGKILSDLGIWEAEGKSSPPSEVMTFLGVDCNSRTFMLSITEDRLQEIAKLIKVWLGSKNRVSLCEVQLLAGKLTFVCATVRLG